MSVSSLVQQGTRGWAATLSWGDAADAGGTTELTFSFADIQSLTEVAPKRDAGTGTQEVQCERYVELLGTLHAQTRDGRWNAQFPAAIQVHSTGDTTVRASDMPLPFFAAPWSSSLDPAGHATLFSELTTSGAAGELFARTTDGARHVAASWK